MKFFLVRLELSKDSKALKLSFQRWIEVEKINSAAPDNGGQSNEESEDSSGEEDDDSSSSSSDSDSLSSSGDDDEDEDESSSSSSDKELDDELEEGEIGDGGDEFIFGSDGEEAVVPKGPTKSKHEIEDYPPVPAITAFLEPHHQTSPVGVVSSIMGSKIIVEGSVNHSPLNEGSILWITETRLPLGIVDEIFGPVKNPYYIVRYNSESEIPGGVRSGIPVSCVADFADHIINYKSLYEKGHDASGKRDRNRKAGSNVSGSNKKRCVSKCDDRFGKFNAPQPTFSNTGDGLKGTSSASFPPQHSNGTSILGMPPQQFASGPPQRLPPRPHNMGMPGGGYPMMPNQQQNLNFGMMHFQQQQQILTNALSGLIGLAGLGPMPFGSGHLGPAFNQGGLGQVLFGSMIPNASGQVPFRPTNLNPSGQVQFGPIYPNPSSQVQFGPTNPNPSGQVPFGSINPGGQMVNQNGFGWVPLGSMPNQGEMGGTGLMQFNSGRSFSSSVSGYNGNNRGRGRSFGRGRGRNAFGSRGGSKHNQ